MKKIIQAIVALVVPLFTIFYAEASFSEILTVPYRGAASMQTAATTIEFESSSLGAGASITVEAVNVSVPSSPCAGVACLQVGATPNGDDILVARISGTNRVQLTLTYLSSFPTNYCVDPGIGSYPKTFDITLTDFNFSTPNPEYRIASFMAPSDASCDIPYARVPTVRPSFAAASTWTKLGRLALNVVLVLDKSGSMNWTIPGSTDIRWDRMTSSVNLFASVWDVIGAPPAPATESSEGDPRDKLGLIFFSTSSGERPLDPPSFFKERGIGASPWGAVISGILTAEPVGGWTSLGSGLVNARAQLDSVDEILGDTAIILFTDGEQNRPPCVIRTGETITPTNVPYPGSTSTYVNECSVSGAIPNSALLEISGDIVAQDIPPRGPIFTLGLGEGGMAASAQLLDEISTETSGRSWFPINGLMMDTSFVDSLVQNLKGGTVSLLDRFESNIPAQTQSGAPNSIHIDPSITRVIFALSWDGQAHQEVELQVQHPNGTSANPSLQSSGKNFRVYAFDNAVGNDGKWVAMVSRHSNERQELNYQLSAYSVESQFSSRVTETQELGTGQPIKIVVEVGWGNAALDSLPNGAIKAFIEKPGENLGNILQDTDYPRDTEIRNDSSPLALKVDQLARDNELFERVNPLKSSNALSLIDVGGGRYETSFDRTNIGGKYRIRVEFDWDDSRTGPIKRLQYSERQVPVLPTADDSVIGTQIDKKTGLPVLEVNLKDSFGNYVGPGFENSISVLVNEQPIEIEIADPEVKGIYRISSSKFSISDDPKIDILFSGNTIRKGKLSGLGGASSQCPWYDPTCGLMSIKYLILILILIFAFLLIRKVIKK